MADQPGNPIFHFLIEARGRIFHSLLHVVMFDTDFIMRIGQICTCSHHLSQPVISHRNSDLRPATQIGFQDVGQFAVSTGDTPFRGTMDNSFRFALACMEWLDRIRVIVAQHASRVDRILPLAISQCCDSGAIPLLCRINRSAPIVVSHVQNVILEVFEGVIRSLRPVEINFDVLQTQVSPVLCDVAPDLIECVQSQLVVSTGALPGKQDVEEC